MSWLRASNRRIVAIASTATAVVLIAVTAFVALNTTQHDAEPPSDDRPESAWSVPRTVYFPETGHTLDRLFLDLWRNRGGGGAFGHPITSELTLDNGHVVQYLEYARFEYWPEGDAAGNLVVLGKVGADLRPLVDDVASTDSTVANQATCQDPGEAEEASPAWRPIDRDDVGPDTANLRYIEETGHSVSSAFKEYWEATGETALLGNPLSEEYVVAGTSYQVFERGQLAQDGQSDPWLVPIGETLVRCYGLDTTPQPQGDFPIYDESIFIPKPAPSGSAPQPPDGYDRSIVVSLSRQALWAYEGDTVVRSVLVSTGKTRFETPPGLFFINTKVPVQDMEGNILGEYYFEAHVPDVMYFTYEGHAIHGVYWHNNFGAPMSHGCINVPLGTSLWLFDWASIGTPVLILQ